MTGPQKKASRKTPANLIMSKKESADYCRLLPTFYKNLLQIKAVHDSSRFPVCIGIRFIWIRLHLP